MTKRPEAGRGLFYTRDSGGRHETTPGQYVEWARARANELGVSFDGTPDAIHAMIREEWVRSGPLFLDYGVTGNKLSRPVLDALIEAALSDRGVSHVFIPRRDRLDRPDDAVDRIELEARLREAGLTIVFSDQVALPLPKGSRRDIAELIAEMLAYDQAGRFRQDLAAKMLASQLTLARAGFSTGGRPPYGFRRWLVRPDGTRVRELADGESVRMAGHHVAWLPTAEDQLATCRMILEMLERTPARRVAETLTAEGVPTPYAGRPRGRQRAVGRPAWSPTSVVNIARNPLIAAVVTYGKRSQGDQLRFSPRGPRPLSESDYREDDKPKVVTNPRDQRVEAPASFEPIIDPGRHARLVRMLDERGKTQRGKARSRDPRRNPLGGRVFDMNCGWPMYRESRRGSFLDFCGLYMQVNGGGCDHNH